MYKRQGLDPGAVINAVRDAGLEFTDATGTGVVLYMLSGLGIDGRLGFVAIGYTPEDAEALAARVRGAIDGLVV